ncbi:P-II family nitrogen regulator [Candidatus Sulfurimonas baltica]|uniref:P-II family nitrogen regulator n=1 Tax=Candidatus Sulfurimonas baltica TaxID=2740404 RepID=A0A7S7LXD3_9BACT|nr:P-II family nitrogen regulator [Candidatus Sulfurimonas baltica]QOY53135.1 P-II family nitrogen regulator [Candidatus Sulfurimonas baltica]
MYMVMTVINQHDLKNVLEDLFANNIEGITVSDVIGKGSFGLKEADNQPTDLVSKVKLEIVVSDVKHREIAMECIRSNCHDLGRGAGKMWWLDVGGVERIRTGEKDADALTTQVNKKIQNVPCGLTTQIDTPCS